ncbi:hypothetical protein [Anaerosporobacter sp.]
MKQCIVRYTKLMFITTSLLIFLCSCNNSVDNTRDSIEFEKVYSGFIMCDSDMTNEYKMSDYYIITNEKDWERWNSKYTLKFPYFQDELDWDQYCLITYAWVGAKDFGNTIDDIDTLDFDNDGVLTITYDSNPKSSIYAFDTTDIRHVAIEVIKIKKSDLPSNVRSSYYEYSTESN